MIFDISPPKESGRYLRISMIRTAILFFVVFAFLKWTEIWPGFEDNVIILGIFAIIYHFAVYFIKRRKERKIT